MLQQTICSVFNDGQFTGNLAATIILEEFLPVLMMQKIAMQNNLPETTFLVPGNGEYQIRWFTPTQETVMAGHATLAAAYTVIQRNGSEHNDRVFFRWNGGRFEVWKDGDVLWMEFPHCANDLLEPLHGEAVRILQLAGIKDSPTFIGKDVVVVLESEENVRLYQPNLQFLLELPGRGLAITSSANSHDYCSRFFCPRFGVLEDPVTGSSHAILAPYWAKHFGRNELKAWQHSKSGGLVFSQVKETSTLIGGRVSIYSKADIFV